MLRRLLPLVLLASAVVPIGSAEAQVPWPVPTLTTPEGPATLTVVDRRVRSRPGIEPMLLTGLVLRVGAGSRAGRVRPRVLGAVAGPWTDVPATPGLVLLPLDAPYPQASAGGLDGGALALDQDVGGQVTVSEARYLDFPEGIQAELSADLDVHAGDPPPGVAAPVTEHRPGQALALDPVLEEDTDGDGVPDSRQRTDLVTTVATAGSTPTRRRVVVTVLNRGPSTTSGVGVRIDVPAGAVLAPVPGEGCPMPPLVFPNAMTCDRGALTPGARRTTTFDVVTDVTTSVHVATYPVGLDLDPATDEVRTAVPAPSPVLRLTAPARERVHGGALRVRVGTTRTGSFRLRATVALGGRRWHAERRASLTADGTRSVALALPAGLRRTLAARAGRRGPLATLVLDGGGATRVVRHVRIVP